MTNYSIFMDGKKHRRKRKRSSLGRSLFPPSLKYALLYYIFVQSNKTESLEGRILIRGTGAKRRTSVFVERALHWFKLIPKSLVITF